MFDTYFTPFQSSWSERFEEAKEHVLGTIYSDSNRIEDKIFITSNYVDSILLPHRIEDVDVKFDEMEAIGYVKEDGNHVVVFSIPFSGSEELLRLGKKSTQQVHVVDITVNNSDETKNIFFEIDDLTGNAKEITKQAIEVENTIKTIIDNNRKSNLLYIEQLKDLATEQVNVWQSKLATNAKTRTNINDLLQKRII